MTEAEVGGMHTEDRGRGYEPREAGGRWKLEKARKQILPGASSRNAALSTPRH